MAPIHRSDVDEERWTQDEWRNYELWEKLEERNRGRRRLWLIGAGVLFLLLSSVPIIMERLPRWRSLAAARRLSVELGAVKREAALEHTPYLIRFLGGQGGLEYQVERVASCEGSLSSDMPGSPEGVLVRRGELMRSATELALIPPSEGARFGLDGLLREFCYDPLRGSEAARIGKKLTGFAIAPVKDLATGELGRAAIVLIDGPLAEVSFN